MELERLLLAHGATGIMSGWDATLNEHRLMFRVGDRMIRFTLPLPTAEEFRLTPTGRRRTANQVAEQVSAETRRRWRSLLLVTKARFVAVEDGVLSLEDAFMSDIVLPDGQTISEWLHPQLDTAYATAQMPSLLPGVVQRPALEAGS